MNFKKKSKELIEALLILTTKNQTSERKSHVIKNIRSGFILSALGFMLKPEINNKIIDSVTASASNMFDVDDKMSPLDAVVKGLELGSNDMLASILFAASAYCFSASVSSNFSTPEKDRLIDYGKKYCPYESYNDYKNDFRSKFIYKFSNKLELMAYSRDKGSYFRRALFRMKSILLKTTPKVFSKHRVIMDLLGRPDLGYLTLVHHNKKYNNPKFVNQLIIPRELKDEIREDLMDLNCSDRVESRTFVQNIISESSTNIKHEVEERNLNLSLVRLIDDIIMNEISNKEASLLLESLMNISENSSTEKRSMYVDLKKVVEYVFLEKGLNNIKIKNYRKNQSSLKRAYHIMIELDRICYQELKIEPIKKPLSYREIVANETVFSVQRSLRGQHALDAINNKKEQSKSPLYKNHYFRNNELKETMDNDRFGNNKNGYYNLISRKNFKICGIEQKELKNVRRKIRKAS